jgi:hypothetical protein
MKERLPKKIWSDGPRRRRRCASPMACQLSLTLTFRKKTSSQSMKQISTSKTTGTRVTRHSPRKTHLLLESTGSQGKLTSILTHRRDALLHHLKNKQGLLPVAAVTRPTSSRWQRSAGSPETTTTFQRGSDGPKKRGAREMRRRTTS